MEIGTEYRSAFGTSIDDCSMIGIRYDEAYGVLPDECECWMGALRSKPGSDLSRYVFQRPSIGWYSDLWRSPAGRVYVTDLSRNVQINDDLWAPDADLRWQEHALDVPLLGVWGIDDAHVFAWGTSAEDRHAVYRWDGTRFVELPSPGFEVRAMHGTASDVVYAVGSHGSVARWDGRRWREAESGVAEHLISVFVASPDEIYATGSAGSLLEGSAHGWGVITRGPLADVGMPLHAVAKWRGELWVGGGAQGLFKRAGITGRLDVVRSDIHATSFDARGDLLMTCFDEICSTPDGHEFFSSGEGALLSARDGYELGDID